MKYFYLLFLFASLEVSFGCNLDCSQVTCAQSFNPFDCPSNTLYSNTAALCGCCPGCVRLKGIPNRIMNLTSNIISENWLKVETYSASSFMRVTAFLKTEIFPDFIAGPNEECESDTKLTFDVTNFYTVKGSIILNATDVPPVVASKECAPGLTCDNSRCSSKLLMSSKLWRNLKFI